MRTTVNRLLVDDDAANLRARQDVAAVASDEEVLARIAEGLLRRDVHDSDVVPVDLPGEPRAPDDRHRLTAG